MKSIKYFFVVLFEFLMVLLFTLPRFRLLNFFKSLFLRLMGAKIGKRVVFYLGVWIMTGKNLFIGDDVDLAKDVIITSKGGVSIGSRTLIGYRTQILSSNHHVPPVGSMIYNAGHNHKPINIGKDVWIGSNCIITAGVNIESGSVIAAGSIRYQKCTSKSNCRGKSCEIDKRKKINLNYKLIDLSDFSF